MFMTIRDNCCYYCCAVVVSTPRRKKTSRPNNNNNTKVVVLVFFLISIAICGITTITFTYWTVVPIEKKEELSSSSSSWMILPTTSTTDTATDTATMGNTHTHTRHILPEESSSPSVRIRGHRPKEIEVHNNDTTTAVATTTTKESRQHQDPFQFFQQQQILRSEMKSSSVATNTKTRRRNSPTTKSKQQQQQQQQYELVTDGTIPRSISSPITILQNYKRWHSVHQLRLETTTTHFNHSQQQQHSNHSQHKHKRLYSIVFYSCPQQFGNRMYHYLNSFLWSIITNRTILLKYYDYETCITIPNQLPFGPYMKKMKKTRNQNNDTDDTDDSSSSSTFCNDFFNNNEIDCNEYLKPYDWIPRFDDWAPILFSSSSSSSTSSSSSSTISSTTKTKTNNSRIIKNILQSRHTHENSYGIYHIHYWMTRPKDIPWYIVQNQHPWKKGYKQKYHSSSLDIRNDLQLVSFPYMIDTLLKVTLQSTKHRNYLLTTNSARTIASQLTTRTNSSGNNSHNKNNPTESFIYGMLFRESFQMNNTKMMMMMDQNEDPSGSSFFRISSSKKNNNYVTTTASINNKSNTTTTANNNNNNNDNHRISIGIHSRHRNSNLTGETIWNEQNCIRTLLEDVYQNYHQLQEQQQFYHHNNGTRKPTGCIVYIMSDRPRTIQLLKEWIETEEPHQCQVIHTAAAADTESQQVQINDALEVEHGPRSGGGFIQDLSLVSKARHGVIKTYSSTGSSLLESLISYDRIMEVLVQYQNQQPNDTTSSSSLLVWPTGELPRCILMKTT